MELQIERLIELLKQLAIFLERYNRTHWVSWIQKDIHLIERYDFEGMQHFLSAFGGMGSLNDVYFCPQNGDSIVAGEIEEENATFQSLLSGAAGKWHGTSATKYAIKTDREREVDSDLFGAAAGDLPPCF